MMDDNFSELHWLFDIIQSTNIGIVVLDRELRVQLFNRFMQVHSGVEASLALGQPILEVFPGLPAQWLTRRVGSVLDLGTPVYTTWQERPCLFDFPLRLPIHYELDFMYQNVMFVPLRTANNEVERVGLVIYDVTESATAHRKLEEAQGQLLRLSRTDRLTGLWGRGYWEERLYEEYRRARRTGSPAALVMLDIDHFKRVNDSYGHPVGDDAIRMVARSIFECCRDIDIPGRYGGEEFGVVLPETGREGAKVFCERLRKRVEGEMLHADGETIRATVSLGIAELSERVLDAADWLQRADRGLYQAKRSGRNRTCIHEDG